MGIYDGPFICGICVQTNGGGAMVKGETAKPFVMIGGRWMLVLIMGRRAMLVAYRNGTSMAEIRDKREVQKHIWR